MITHRQHLTCCYRGRAGSGVERVGMCLFDILHEVPMLLELLPSESLAALLAVSRQYRTQIHEHVRYIAVPDQEHIQTLVRGTWPRLAVWHVGGCQGLMACIGVWRYTLPNASDAAVSLLAKGHWPQLGEMQLDRGSISAAGIAQLHHTFALRSCSLYSVGLTSAALQAFCALAWSQLRWLDLSGNKMDVAAISYLGAAFWPHLKELDLSCTALSDKAFLLLCHFSSTDNSSWPALTHLYVSGNRMRHLRLPLLLMPTDRHQVCTLLGSGTTSWACQMQFLDLSDNNLTPSAIKELTGTYWPHLRHLCLKHTTIDIMISAMSHCDEGRWPMMSELDLSGVAVDAAALQVLLTGFKKLDHLHLTANLRNAAVYQQLVAAFWHQEQHLSRQVVQDASSFVLERSHGWKCMQQVTIHNVFSR